MLNNSTILITGGTGSFGKKFTRMIFSKYHPKKVIIFSRDEFKQYRMGQDFPETEFPIRFFLGDIRDKSRLYRAFEGVDYVVHAAALKQVPALEYNPTEAVKTNVDGADNIVDAAIDAGVKKVIALSTDKAVNPVNLYGATKLVAEKIFIAANAYAGDRVKFSVVRYGNVVGSRGSVIPFYLDLSSRGIKEFPVTDERMTRFWITLDQGGDLVFKALKESVGGEVFIPKIPSMKLVDLARAIEPECRLKHIGIRPGEKIHETLVSQDEARDTRDEGDVYVIRSPFYRSEEMVKKYDRYPRVPGEFSYASDNNPEWLDVGDLQKMIEGLRGTEGV
ncbi:MAG: UDP-N-acetylglucosamine 4,6-dehydratase (inverting) [Candidatus Omnitrophica bacterium]|nr:UDP-N-acetylglucosamine 4,6-dehydratase (inverting) [Candidatus Omnitrophota bacterium]MDD5488837.1 UDP-N-acetylglucosamine 4,6-dehydratase (inverting) [Candidatus Omnitrophota bacterium]